MKLTINTIETKEDYEDTLKRIKVIFNSDSGTPEDKELGVLLLLVKEYEDINYPISKSDPIDIINFTMDQMGLRRKDLIPYIGQVSHVSEVLNGQRNLSLAMIRNLSKGLSIPIELLIPEKKVEKMQVVNGQKRFKVLKRKRENVK